MKIILSCLVLCFAIYVSCDDKYTSKYDKVDIDEILGNQRLLNAYYKCLMEGTGCTPDGNELKNVLPDALETSCQKCSDRQKELAKKTMRRILKEHNDMWQSLMDKYDPEKKYRDKFQKELEEL